MALEFDVSARPFQPNQPGKPSVLPAPMNDLPFSSKVEPSLPVSEIMKLEVKMSARDRAFNA